MAFVVAIFAAIRSHQGCPGPHSGWMSSAPSSHNEVVPLGTGQGHLLCCDGVLGATPDIAGSSAVVERVVDHPNQTLHVVSFFSNVFASQPATTTGTTGRWEFGPTCSATRILK